MGIELTPEAIDAVVLCGGKGKRLGPLTQRTPKPLLFVGGRPFLFHLLSSLRGQGFRRFILATHYLSEKFQDFLAAYALIFDNCTVVCEKEPLGTGGALRNAVMYVRSSFFIALNGDSYIPQPLAPVLDHHTQTENSFTMVAARAENVVGGVENKGAVRLGAGGAIVGVVPGGKSEGWVNAGIYVLDRATVLSWPTGQYDLESHLMSLLGGRKGQVFCSDAQLLDIGTPECYAQADQHLAFPDPKDSA